MGKPYLSGWVILFGSILPILIALLLISPIIGILFPFISFILIILIFTLSPVIFAVLYASLRDIEGEQERAMESGGGRYLQENMDRWYRDKQDWGSWINIDRLEREERARQESEERARREIIEWERARQESMERERARQEQERRENY